MRIAICDEDRAQLDLLQSLVSEWADERREDCRISFFESAQAFWLSCARESFDVLLLDGRTDGELARELRGGRDGLRIIFTADEPGGGADAEPGLLKPAEREKLFSALDAALGRGREEDESKLFLRWGDKTLAFREDRILCIEAFSHTVRLCTRDGDFSVPLGLGEVCRRLSGDKFIRVHRSYAVNLQAVQRLRRYELTLDGGRHVPVSRLLYDKVRNAFSAANNCGRQTQPPLGG